MERLTQRDEMGTAYRRFQDKDYDMIQRLAEYEDTGLTPAEIGKLKLDFQAMCNRCRELPAKLTCDECAINCSRRRMPG